MEVHKEEPGIFGIVKWRQVLTDCPYLFSIFNFPFPQPRVKLWGKWAICECNLENSSRKEMEWHRSPALLPPPFYSNISSISPLLATWKTQTRVAWQNNARWLEGRKVNKLQRFHTSRGWSSGWGAEAREPVAEVGLSREQQAQQQGLMTKAKLNFISFSSLSLSSQQQ